MAASHNPLQGRLFHQGDGSPDINKSSKSDRISPPQNLSDEELTNDAKDRPRTRNKNLDDISKPNNPNQNQKRQDKKSSASCWTNHKLVPNNLI